MQNLIVASPMQAIRPLIPGGNYSNVYAAGITKLGVSSW
jgi:hypothetical protein